jgi:hypothetical protein
LRISQTVQHVNKACNPRTSEDEEGGLWVGSQPGLHSEALFQN